MMDIPSESLEALLAEFQPTGFEKVQTKLSSVEQIDKKTFFYLFAISSRWFEASSASIPSSNILHERDTFDITSDWNWPTLARLYLLLLVSEQHPAKEYISLYKSLFSAADVQENIVLIQCLAFVPCADAFIENAREAARSNITTLFSAIAHNNDYAYTHFDELGWNQLVLKAAFLSLPILRIFGLRSRNNIRLVNMLCDYAKERQAASRSVPWDLWCCVSWVANSEADYQLLENQFNRGDTKTKAAIAFGLSENQKQEAMSLSEKLIRQIDAPKLPRPLSWEGIENYEEFIDDSTEEQ